MSEIPGGPGRKPGASLGRRVAGGAAWLVALRLGLRFLGLFNIVVLARLLVPEDFGLVAMATAAQGLLTAMAEFRPDLALIRETGADKRHYDTVWTLSVLRGAVIALMLALGATYYGAFFEEPRLVFILYLFAVSALVDGFQNVGIVDFFKDLELDKQFRFMLVTRVLVVLITWAVAFIWRNYWALVVGALLERVVPTIYSYRVHPYRPAFSLSMWRQIGGFSLWLMLNNFLTFLNGRSSTFVLGKLAGPAVVGNYTLSQRIIYLPGSEIAAPIRQAVYPGYAKLSGEPERLGDGFIRVFGLIMLAVVPISAALGLVVDPLVRVALGERWIPAIPIMQVLVFSSIFRVATANAGPLLFALNRPELVSLSNFVGLLVLIPLLIWGVSSAGAVGAAWAVAASSATTLVLNVHWARWSLNMGLGPLLGVSWRPLFGVITMIVATQAAQAGLRELQIPVSELIRLCLLSGVAVTSYVTTVFLLWRMSGSPMAAERDLIGLLPHRVRRHLT